MHITTTSRQSKLPCHFAVASLALAAAMTCGPATAQNASESAADDFVPGRILVTPRAGVPDEWLGRTLSEHGSGKAWRIGKSALRVVEVPVGSEKAIMARLSRNPHVKFVELDRAVSGNVQPNDPMAGSQWHLPKIGAPAAWDSAQGAGVTIAVLDSGIDTKHPDLLDHLVAGYNFLDGNTNVEDVHSHGTKTAGAAAASLNNGVGVASVAGQVKIMPIRVADSSLYATWSAIASGITYAADRGVRVASVSFSGAAGSASVLSAADYMRSKGGLVFISAGNSNVDPGYAATSSVVIVAATNSSDTKASFSNFGKHIHLSAPGEGIYTTTWGQSYTSISGTSFSAPISAGVAALVMSANPSLTAAQVESILFSTAVDLGDPGRDIYYGYGRVDAAAAVAAAKSTSGTLADKTAPTASISAPLGSATVSGLTPVNVSVSDNVGVTKAELLVNGAVAATDTSAPFGFSWDSTTVANGMASLNVRAYDAAGNVGQSATISVNVANPAVVVADTIAPVTAFASPVGGSKVSGNVAVTVNGTDNSGVAGLAMALFINGTQVASTSGSGQLKYTWNTRKIAVGSYTLRVDATDAAGNKSTGSVTVTR